jgi:hypothetical protein
MIRYYIIFVITIIFHPSYYYYYYYYSYYHHQAANSLQCRLKYLAYMLKPTVKTLKITTSSVSVQHTHIVKQPHIISYLTCT